ncbi:proline-rich protein 5-like isoform X2 [Periplaneta americana]|uniref:proline-rich protein 5-like isoform X2 n=1 Tax=Periplaneta americana TaxID=6978 RepID=UPI0037E8F6CD
MFATVTGEESYHEDRTLHNVRTRYMTVAMWLQMKTDETRRDKMAEGPLGRLKRLPTFTVSRGEVQFSLRTVDPMFRFSLTRLVEAASTAVPAGPDSSSPGAEARFAASWDTRFRQEWIRLRAAVHEVFHYKIESAPRKGPAAPLLTRGQLTTLHNDIRVLLRSQAGAFIFEYYQNTLLPGAACLLLEEVERGDADLGARLAATWTHFYCHALPTLEAIFIQVKNQKTSIRQATLLAFRDCVLLQLASRLEPLLEEMHTDGSIPPAIKQMLLVLQSVMECYPPSEKRLKLESLVARVVSPYLGHRGLYEGGYPKPIIPSRELDVAHLRRPSVVDPRRLMRPLSVNSSSPHVETLSDLFALSADRAFHRRAGSRDNM